MKTAISVPDRIFARVDKAAKRLGMSRSEFFARAAERWADQLDQDDLADRINEAVASAGDDESDLVREAARRTLLRDLP